MSTENVGLCIVCSRGIGKAISVGFVREGANVILVARSKAGLAEVRCCW